MTGPGSEKRFPFVDDDVPHVALPLVEVDEAIAQMRRTLAGAALFALAVAALLSFSAAELTSRRLRELTQAARRMALSLLESLPPSGRPVAWAAALAGSSITILTIVILQGTGPAAQGFPRTARARHVPGQAGAQKLNLRRPGGHSPQQGQTWGTRTVSVAEYLVAV